MLRAMQTRSIVLGVLALGCVAVSGCAYGEVRQVIRAQFASELNCPEVSLGRRDMWYAYDGLDQYKVAGCGVTRTYTCPANNGPVSFDKPACTWVAGDADTPEIATSESNGDEPVTDEGDSPDPDGQVDAQDTGASDGSADTRHPEDSADHANEPEKPADAAEGKAPGKSMASGDVNLGGSTEK
jgi:hypothetical protein